MVAKGEYVVKEEGLQFEHNPTVEQDQPCSPQECLLRFRNNFEMNILEQPDANTLVFELIHCDASFANALRRILIAEVPTVALEHIYMWNNNSIVHDEVLAHRLGLIPFDLDARYLEDVEDLPDGEEFISTDRNTVVFRLAVTCPSKPLKTQTQAHASSVSDTNNKSTSRLESRQTMDETDADGVVQPNPELEAAAAAAAAAGTSASATEGGGGGARTLKLPHDRPYTKHVYSSDFVWMPQGDQAETFPTGGVRPVHSDILIAKLRPGQTIELEAHGRRGIGKDHAKYSPVATASYRLMPNIELMQPIYDDLAEELVHLYEPGVFELVPVQPQDTPTPPPGAKVRARLCNPYACTMSRNYMRNPILSRSIRMSRISDHFIFSVESVGAYPPGVLVAEALRVLQRKCLHVMDLVDESTLQEQSNR